MAHVKEPLTETCPADVDTMTASDAKKYAQDAAASILFSMGVSAHMIDNI
jgi:hypothetical protein